MAKAEQILKVFQDLPEFGRQLLETLKTEINNRLAEKDEFEVVASTAISTFAILLGDFYI